MPSDKPRKAFWWLLIAGTLVMTGFSAFIARAWDKVAAGKGLETYFTGWGAQFNYIGFLVLVAVIPVAIAIGYAVKWWDLRHERDFKRRYESDA